MKDILQTIILNLVDKKDEVETFWQDIDKIPYAEMREADRDFLPDILSGKKVNRRYIYDDNFKLLNIINL